MKLEGLSGCDGTYILKGKHFYECNVNQRVTKGNCSADYRAPCYYFATNIKYNATQASVTLVRQKVRLIKRKFFLIFSARLICLANKIPIWFTLRYLRIEKSKLILNHKDTI